ncbi:polycystin-1-like protein 2 [Ptychodera flava]|uniref:polycystin-1-like protein 2 n=1 Tax=Ptychodera flava TaxID=63121 RepID=UPI00396AA260
MLSNSIGSRRVEKVTVVILLLLTLASRTEPSSGTCSFLQFTCNSGQCISGVAMCDGTEDCSDGSDETVGCSDGYFSGSGSGEEDCGGSIYIDSNQYEDISSPGYPNADYTNNLECIWNITTWPGDYLTTHFLDFDTESGFDIVILGNGGNPDNQSSIIAKASGSRPPDDILSSSNKIWLKFVSDSSFGAAGFSMRVQFVSGVVVTTQEPEPTAYDVSISCISNCYDVIDAAQPLIAEVTCENCASGQNIQYSWKLFYTASSLGLGAFQEESMDQSFTATGTSSSFIYINSGNLGNGYTYKLKANLTMSDGFGTATWAFVTNSPPTSGNCSVTPTSGYAVESNFVVTCANWEDSHTPLEYAFRSRPKGSSSLSLLSSGSSSTSPQFMLEMGSEGYNYEVDIVVEIIDAYNSKATETLTVTVEPPQLTGDSLIDSLKNLTSGESSLLDSLISGGDTDAAVSLVLTVASVLNSDTSANATEEENAEAVNARKEMRESMIGNIKAMSESVGSADEVSQMASALLSVTAAPDELTETSQVESAAAMESLSASLLSMANETAEAVVSSATAITEATANVLSTVLTTNDDSAVSTPSASTSSTVVKSAVNAVNSVSKAILSKRVPGQEPVIINTTSLNVQLQRDTPLDIDGASLTSGQGSFKLPSSSALLGGKANDRFVDLQYMTFVGNPFNWEDSSRDISSSVVALSFTDVNGDPVDISGLDIGDSIAVELPMNSDLPDLEMLNETAVDPGADLVFFRVEVPTAYSAIHFRVFPNMSWNEVNYTLFFEQDTFPTTSSFNYSKGLPNVDYENDMDLSDAIREELKYTFVVPGDRVPINGSYYIGILYEPGTLNISTQTFVTGCRYWDEVEETYKGDGCVTTAKSSSMMTYCSCNHLTSFGSDFIVAPNSIDFSTVFSKFGSLNENASVFATIFVILGLYIAAVVWARREDRKDVEKWGVTPLPDNRKRHRYFYQITVYTGMKAGSGTRSKVSMILKGSQGETQIRRLKDKKRRVFKRGSICTFMMAVPVSLGDLKSVHVWHDNSGKGQRASWYLSKMIIHDVQTKEAFYFLCERWLAVEKDDGLTNRLLDVASNGDIVKFNRLFSARARKDLTDGHIWFSVIARPSRSNFTRVQRLTCCLSLLYTTMIANCMWFKGEDEETTGYVVRIGPFSVAWQSIYVGIMGSLIVFPVNLILIQLFRLSRQKSNRTVDLTQGKKYRTYNSDHGAGDCGKSSDVDEALRAVLRNMEEGDSAYGRATGQMAGRPSKASIVTRKNINFSIATECQSKSNGAFEKSTGGMNATGGRNDRKLPIQNGKSRGENATGSESGKEKKKEKKPFSLPHWCVYIAYCLGFLSSAGSAFFTVLYSLEWGHEKSVEWLVSFFMSFFQSLLIIQPLKVLCLAILLSLIFKKVESDVEVYDVKLKDDEEYLHDSSKMEADLIKYKPPVFDPPDPKMLEDARIAREKEEKMMELIKEIVTYLLYMAVVWIIAYANRDKMAYYLHKSIDDQLFQNRHFNNIEGGVSYFGTWTTDVLIPSLYPTQWYDSSNMTSSERKFISDMASFRVGPPRLRHLRIRDGYCRVLKQLSALIPYCYAEYSSSTEDERSFNEFWSSVNSSGADQGLWGYQTSGDLDGVAIYGVSRFYGGGGYVAELGSSPSQAEATWSTIWNAKWVDHYTRAVLVEFPLYNANVNLFSMVTLLLEFPATGASLAYTKISVLRLYNYLGHSMAVYLTCELIFAGFVIFFIVRAILQVKKLKTKYFKSFWNWVEMLKIFMALTGIMMHLYKNIFLGSALKTLSNGGSQDFINLQGVAAMDEVFLYVLSTVVFVSFIKLLHLLRFNRRISLLSKTLSRIARDLGSFGLMFAVVMFAFSQVFYLVIGAGVEDYKSFIAAFETLLSVWLGVFDYNATVETSPILASIIFFAFNVVMIIGLTTVFIAIIVYSFAIINAENQDAESEYELVDFIVGGFKDMCGPSGDDSDDDSEDEGGDEGATSQAPVRIPPELCDIAALEDRVAWIDSFLYRVLKAHGISISGGGQAPFKGKKVSFADDFFKQDSHFTYLSGRCHACRQKMNPRDIERHLIFLCNNIREQRRAMFRNMVEVLGNIEHVMVRSRARSWWKFYRDNSKTLRLTYMDVVTGKFEVRKETMTFYHLPPTVEEALSGVVTCFLENALMDSWKELKGRKMSFNLNDFVLNIR